MKQFFCGLGSNLGNSQENVRLALKKINDLEGIEAFQASSLYLTSPVSNLVQPNFINAVCAFKTMLSPLEVFECTQQIEKELGKVPKKKEEPRKIDIDLLYVEGVKMQNSQLILPHPGLFSRLFVLKPLLELSSSLTLSVLESFDILSQVSHLEGLTSNWVRKL